MTVCLIMTGCGGGPPRFELTGKVTFNGQPVPRGYIVFAPDSSQGNSGPGTHATIVDGMYKTPETSGVLSGPHKVTITGFDGKSYQDGSVTIPDGKPLFADVETKVNLPANNSTQDFALPISR